MRLRPEAVQGLHDHLKLDEYQKLAGRTINPEQSHRDNLGNFALGLTGEAGETGDYIKKHLYHGHDLDPEVVKSELGDVLWYVAALATAVGLDLSDVAQGNVDKLKKRYPEGFSQAASKARVDVDVEEGQPPVRVA
ncbi:nucleoside triphosphate pyrophosphohydrolase family protein [Deltaproteobacteria bacterium]|nr:nucleoside triphosphate pyrophosphohydrolase family protein [Deltaproteobacteria bacterium]